MKSRGKMVGSKAPKEGNISRRKRKNPMGVTNHPQRLRNVGCLWTRDARGIGVKRPNRLLEKEVVENSNKSPVEGGWSIANRKQARSWHWKVKMRGGHRDYKTRNAHIEELVFERCSREAAAGA